MKSLDLQSERFEPTGNLVADGALNQLGRPDLNPLTVLVRETVQNSWDARLSNKEPVRFGISGYTLNGRQADFLRTTLFNHSAANLSFDKFLHRRSSLNVLAIYDQGTVGLRGPTRADAVGYEEEPGNFVDFLRNIGQVPNRELGGGTYGYGKAALYRMSELSTICVHTHCHTSGRIEKRFMAAALGSPFTIRDGRARGRYTGRHWWGRCKQDGIVDPVQGSEADEIANKLGMPAFTGNETGTTLLILLPRFGDFSPDDAMNFMAENLLWFFWPKMLKRKNGKAAMQFSLAWNGNPVNLPTPSDFPPLQGFAKAMENLKEVRGGKDINGVTSIRSQRPSQELGLLSLVRFPAAERIEISVGTKGSPKPLEGLCHHVALMRNAELVVKYVPGPALPNEYIEYAGVFIADATVDQAFANAEPPTHDDWIPRTLNDALERTYVNVALRRVKEALESFAAPPDQTRAAGSGLPLGAFAETLGGLIPGEEGTGASVKPIKPTRSGGGSATRRMRVTRATVEVIGDGVLLESKNAASLKVDCKVEHAKGTKGSFITADPRVLVQDGGAVEVDPPAGVERPKVIRWLRRDGTSFGTKDRVFVPSTVSVLSVVVSIPPDSMVMVLLGAEESTGQ